MGFTSLRDQAPEYRQRAWEDGLRRAGVHDPAIATQLSESFRMMFRTVHRPFDDVLPLLNGLRGLRLGVITNGWGDLQRTKLRTSRLHGWFDPILISSEQGLGKPDRRFFELALARMGVTAEECVMVGDGLIRDVKGALAVGIEAVWLERGTSPAEPDGWDGRRIVSLSEFKDVLAALR